MGPAFGRRCIPPPPQRDCRVGGPGAGCVAPPSNTPGILRRRAVPAGRLAALGATTPFMRWVLVISLAGQYPGLRAILDMRTLCRFFVVALIVFGPLRPQRAAAQDL